LRGRPPHENPAIEILKDSRLIPEPNSLDKVEMVAAITAFNVAQFAYMIKMANLREGDGTLLDNCIIVMWGSGLEDGNKHSREKDLPFILAGRGGGSIATGRFLPDIKGNQGDLLSTLLTCAGIPLDRPIGIATRQITEITG
jgi:hypothetical protein